MIYARLLALGGGALAVLLTLFGLYRRGAKAARYAQEVQSARAVRRNLKVSRRVEDEIRQNNLDDDTAAVNRLREKWRR